MMSDWWPTWRPDRWPAWLNATPIEDHPAKFNDTIRDAIYVALREHLWLQSTENGPVNILDPFAGIGGIHFLGQEFDTFACELQPGWAAASLRQGWTWCGDWFDFKPTDTFHRMTPFHGEDPLVDACSFGRDDWIDAVVTSCTYGNRMADKHDAKEKCKACGGRGHGYRLATPGDCMSAEEWVCDKCDGTGTRDHVRLTYTHKLRAYGEEPVDNNSGTMQWGDEYRAFHHYAWRKVARLLQPGGLFILNVKDHVRGKKLQHVPQWHRDKVLHFGFKLIKDVHVPVRGMGFGQHQQELKVDYEHVYVFRKEPT
jgi:hypothetical protein